MDNNKTLKSIKSVSEYLAAGAMEIGYLLEGQIKETAKAVAFPGVKFNSYGNPYNSMIWLPKSQLTAVKNDFYTDGPSSMFLCPVWLYRKNPTLGEVAV